MSFFSVNAKDLKGKSVPCNIRCLDTYAHSHVARARARKRQVSRSVFKKNHNESSTKRDGYTLVVMINVLALFVNRNYSLLVTFDAFCRVLFSSFIWY